ncbi:MULTISPECIES: acyl carrier protein [Clostridium]|mgnify:CR=1 FL=1|uniref:Acyl carrier protein n=1 Tax=Clostridium cadaveris TaxID=1529 RepID=A0A1I2QEU3_9CLOT|nr:acyl carrier protein [Clostridium cadaveris]MDU4952005.1 acyl carrier protein [Clostridium sp.]MDM8311806.1 acyl carrier protein [Clostridium cadaveris]NME65888.1 acyl carrier protein [Clostridium cadaveris]NWK11875.1 acyl carrier protein [Clostridium cadaveris]PWL53013.1 MAG: acyl carrier protein [Clostridium cadaveris]
MVFEKVKEIVVEQLGLEGNEITEETSFDSLGVDSLDLFQIIIEIEEAFNIQIENAEEMKTVKDAVKYIESKIA